MDNTIHLFPPSQILFFAHSGGLADVIVDITVAQVAKSCWPASGNKLLHNVVGGIGVVEGNGGVMRAGLPWQSVHDGERYAHTPLRLSVCIAAPREAMTDILCRHDGVRALFDNRWMHLFALDETGRMAWRYAGDLQWAATGETIEISQRHRLAG